MEALVRDVNDMAAAAARLEHEGFQSRSVTKYLKAKDEYCAAAKGYHEILNGTENEDFRRLVKLKIVEMSERAEMIKDWLDENRVIDGRKKSKDDVNVDKGKIMSTRRVRDKEQVAGNAQSPRETGVTQERTLEGSERIEKALEGVHMTDPNSKPTTTDEISVPSERDDESTGLLEQIVETMTFQELPDVMLKDVFCAKSAKVTVKEAVIEPMNHPDTTSASVRRKLAKGVLLYGPHAQAKTQLGQAIAKETRASFLQISPSTLLEQREEMAVELLRQLFRMAKRIKPALIFLPDVDQLTVCSKTENNSVPAIRDELLRQMRSLEGEFTSACSGVLVLASTRVPWDLDPTIRLRFSKRIYLPLPDKRVRVKMLSSKIGSTEHLLEPEDFLYLGKSTDGFSEADITFTVQEVFRQRLSELQNATFFRQVQRGASIEGEYVHYKWTPSQAGAENAIPKTLAEIGKDQLLLPPLHRSDFEKVISRVAPSVGEEEIRRHVQFTAEFGQGEN